MKREGVCVRRLYWIPDGVDVIQTMIRASDANWERGCVSLLNAVYGVTSNVAYAAMIAAAGMVDASRKEP